MLKLEHVYKSFDNKIIIKDFSFVFKDNGNYLITGKSGIGKTTLFNIITGILKPDKGIIENSLTYAPLFQQYRLFEEYTALENLKAVNDNLNLTIIHHLLKDVELNKKVKYLSGGQKQRVCILRALLADSDCIIMDEPFTGLDKKTALKALKTILKYKNNRTLIIFSHNLEFFDQKFKIISLN